MNIILFDTLHRAKLFPLTLTKAASELRVGILTIRERWTKIFNANVFVLTDAYLQNLYTNPSVGEYIFIDSSVIPNKELIDKISSLKIQESIWDEFGLIAGRAFFDDFPAFSQVSSAFKKSQSINSIKRIVFPFDLFHLNAEMIAFDFTLLTKNRLSVSTHNSVQLINPESVFIEEGGSINYSVLNASAGPIYIAKNATVMEGCFIRGPFALCEGAVLKMGTKVYGATTIGPFCSGGGEIKNSILSAYSNKGHEGYLGDSVIGEWCNMGAGTSNSNVKNTGSTINLPNYALQNGVAAGNKCGVIMGDYSRTAINSSINTGSVIGVCCNVFGSGLLPKFIPDFTWGSKPDKKYESEKVIKDIGNWKKMKNKAITENETQVLKLIFENYTTR